jgi:hypothetical protein
MNSENTRRVVKHRIYFPVAFTGSAPVILVSHGGDGATNAETRSFPHLGREYASHGYLSIHLNHLPSSNVMQHRLDRPGDVRATLDALFDGALTLPADFRGSVDFARIAHAGHSWGAYTGHAVGGATFTQGTFTDARIKALVPMSPQGWGNFGAFDDVPDLTRPSSNNSWMNVTLPAYNIVGGNEKDGQIGPGSPAIAPNWRLAPFSRYPAVGDKFLTIIADQWHDDLGGKASDDVNAFVAQSTRAFFDSYLKGVAQRACEIGSNPPAVGAATQRKADPTGFVKECAP